MCSMLITEKLIVLFTRIPPLKHCLVCILNRKGSCNLITTKCVDVIIKSIICISVYDLTICMTLHKDDQKLNMMNKSILYNNHFVRYFYDKRVVKSIIHRYHQMMLRMLQTKMLRFISFAKHPNIIHKHHLVILADYL